MSVIILDILYNWNIRTHERMYTRLQTDTFLSALTYSRASYRNY